MLAERISGIVDQLLHTAELHAERARQAFLRKAVSLGLLAAGGLVLATIALYAAWHFAQGVTQGLAAISGQTWLGDLLGGALLLALTLGGAALVVLGSRRSKRLEREEHESLEELKRSASALGEELVQATELREHVRAHPYVSLGAALAVGAAAAPLVRGSLHGLGPLARSALKSVPGMLPNLPRASAPKPPTNNGVARPRPAADP
ncbi:MAG: hypothetical protein IPJ19_17665 [Planctomycetes bacterium]|nr:hypothetical protein [Planctomycetota bacterium]